MVAVSAVALLALGTLAGGAAYWLTAGHYWPIVEDLQDKVESSSCTQASCRTTARTQEGQVG